MKIRIQVCYFFERLGIIGKHSKNEIAQSRISYKKKQFNNH